MERRGFLKFLGLTPVAAVPLAAKGGEPVARVVERVCSDGSMVCKLKYEEPGNPLGLSDPTIEYTLPCYRCNAGGHLAHPEPNSWLPGYRWENKPAEYDEWRALMTSRQMRSVAPEFQWMRDELSGTDHMDRAVRRGYTGLLKYKRSYTKIRHLILPCGSQL